MAKSNWDNAAPKQSTKKKAGKKKAGKKAGKKRGSAKSKPAPEIDTKVVSMRRNNDPPQQTVVPDTIEDYDEDLNAMGLRCRKARQAHKRATDRVKETNALALELMRSKGVTVYEDTEVRLTVEDVEPKLKVEDRRPKDEQ